MTEISPELHTLYRETIESEINIKKKKKPNKRSMFLKMIQAFLFFAMAAIRSDVV